MTKAKLRKEIRKRRAEISTELRSLYNLQIFERAHKHKAFQLARRVHIYCSSPAEVDTAPFIEYAWGIGKEVFVPVMSGTSDLVHVRITPDTQWEVNGFDIREPVGESPTQLSNCLDGNDCIIVPLVAFDKACHRLGQGGGFYDRFLAETNARRLGIGYECQRVPLVPIEAHDIALEGIATEERWYRV